MTEEETYEPVFSSQKLDENFLQPYEVKTDLEELKQNCELCQELPCCPEHCCNVSITYNLNSVAKAENFLETFN